MPTRSQHPKSGGAPVRRRRTKAEMERARKKSAAARKHHLKTRHRMTLEQYDGGKAYQQGVCAICCRASGVRKALAVDHKHWLEGCDHPHNESCPKCWRGLLCGPCNDLLGHCRDDPLMLLRAADYLEHPPMQEWLHEQAEHRENTDALRGGPEPGEAEGLEQG